MWVANFGSEDLYLRIGFTDGSSQYVSTGPLQIPTDGQWYEVQFDLTDMTAVLGTGSLSDVLSSVTEMRILSAASASWRGDAVAGVLGVDGIQASSTVSTEVSSWSRVKALYNR